MNLAKLEKLIGHEFSSRALLERSVTHRSYANEKFRGADEETLRLSENESLEFVGDSVLGLVIAEELYRRNPASSEGDLTLMKHHLVSTATLADIAKSLEIGNYLRISKGEENTGGRSKPAILADTLEAIFAAVFFDADYQTVRELVVRLFARHLDESTPKRSLDYKTLLQETLQAQKLKTPVYSLQGFKGQPHERTFFVEAEWEGGKAKGAGASIKAAEMMAASEALTILAKEKAECDTTTK